MDHCIIVMRFGANRTSATAAGPPAAATWRFRASVCVMPASGHFTQVSEKTQSRWRRHFPVMLILFYRGASRRSADDQTGKRARCGESWEGAEGGARGGAPQCHVNRAIHITRGEVRSESRKQIAIEFSRHVRGRNHYGAGFHRIIACNGAHARAWPFCRPQDGAAADGSQECVNAIL